jgi:hypothetical protein
MRLFFSDQIGQFRECQEPLWAKFKAKYLSAMRLFLFGGGESDQDELAQPAHFTVLETTSRNQGSELSSATMIPQWPW